MGIGKVVPPRKGFIGYKTSLFYITRDSFLCDLKQYFCFPKQNNNINN